MEKKKNQVLVVTFKSSFPETVEVYYQHGEEIRMKAIKTFIIKNTTFLSPLKIHRSLSIEPCYLKGKTGKIQGAVTVTPPPLATEILRFS